MILLHTLCPILTYLQIVLSTKTLILQVYLGLGISFLTLSDSCSLNVIYDKYFCYLNKMCKERNVLSRSLSYQESDFLLQHSEKRLRVNILQLFGAENVTPTQHQNTSSVFKYFPSKASYVFLWTAEWKGNWFTSRNVYNFPSNSPSVLQLAPLTGA